ncbi:hypothetical protein FACS1894103_4740 [Campylobacterota bacterium]|nr:hypothetical protein FACS1894103_4740 [Campylobacterota bacterium]
MKKQGFNGRIIASSCGGIRTDYGVMLDEPQALLTTLAQIHKISQLDGVCFNADNQLALEIAAEAIKYIYNNGGRDSRQRGEPKRCKRLAQKCFMSQTRKAENGLLNEAMWLDIFDEAMKK